MSYAYYPPGPSKAIMAQTCARWLSDLFRAKVTITIDKGTQGYITIYHECEESKERRP